MFEFLKERIHALICRTPYYTTPTWHLHTSRVLNKSQQNMNLPPTFMHHMNLPPTFLWKLPPPPQKKNKTKQNKNKKILMISIFCSNTLKLICYRMLEMHSKRPRFQNFSRGGMPPDRSSLGTNAFNSMHAGRMACFFPSLPTPKLLPPT